VRAWDDRKMKKEFIKEIVNNILENKSEEITHFGEPSKGIVSDEFEFIANDIAEEVFLQIK